MVDYAVNEEALAVREERKEKHRSGDRQKSKVLAEVRSGELRMIANKLSAMAGKAANLGEPDLAEDIRTCSKFAKKFAEKAASK